ncbi:MAG: hypothetical protein IPH93_02055 [Saprospiraceae bacterium]|nr:hypothetical protein [Saprospiraceae bacterium]MBK7810281.1 hypothetical protein [Saprospiraceae bacterium]MBK9629884.1 hypothetical protein [Saprospiraceae bacterium]
MINLKFYLKDAIDKKVKKINPKIESEINFDVSFYNQETIQGGFFQYLQSKISAIGLSIPRYYNSKLEVKNRRLINRQIEQIYLINGNLN